MHDSPFCYYDVFGTFFHLSFLQSLDLIELNSKAQSNLLVKARYFLKCGVCLLHWLTLHRNYDLFSYLSPIT